ncbi:hypothetical protein, partial [Pseudomonas avellanae]|uniref:hypothetical protein n=1 Tax=Pseudomonas avellanae TaxID=46257 RepID=UPI001E39F237
LEYAGHLSAMQKQSLRSNGGEMLSDMLEITKMQLLDCRLNACSSALSLPGERSRATQHIADELKWLRAGSWHDLSGAL